MGLYDRLMAWLTFPAAEMITYQCTNCSAVTEDPEAACPECGGEIEELFHEPIELYWPHH